MKSILCAERSDPAEREMIADVGEKREEADMMGAVMSPSTE